MWQYNTKNGNQIGFLHGPNSNISKSRVLTHSASNCVMRSCGHQPNFIFSNINCSTAEQPSHPDRNSVTGVLTALCALAGIGPISSLVTLIVVLLSNHLTQIVTRSQTGV